MIYNLSVKILVARHQKEIEFAYEKLSVAGEVGCDTETSSLSARAGRIFSVQFSDGDFNVLVPISEGISLGRLAAILENPSITKIFHNAKFDLEFLRESGYQTTNVYCTMIAEKVLTKGANQSVSLAETLYRYFAVDLDKSHRAKFNRTWNGIWTDELVHYALSDVVYLPELKREQELWLERLGLREDFEKQMARIF
ncbi:ribonuclease D [soil metagenome]